MNGKGEPGWRIGRAFLCRNHGRGDEFFSLPLFPQAVCDEDALRARNVSCTCGNYASSTGLGCATTAAGMGCAGTCGCKC